MLKAIQLICSPEAGNALVQAAMALLLPPREVVNPIQVICISLASLSNWLQDRNTAVK